MTQARLVRNADKQILRAQLISTIPAALLKSTQTLWKNFKDAAIASGAPRSGTYDWDWQHKVRQQNLDGNEYESYGILLDGRIEGLMLLRIRPQMSRINADRKVLYVEYLEGAPWNTPQYVQPENVEYKGVGLSLILTAIAVSEQSGCLGAIGLHSLAQAEGFYKKNHMTDMGVDLAENLRYFELSAEKASDLIQGD